MLKDNVLEELNLEENKVDEMPNDLSSYWMPFTTNRRFKKNPRFLVSAKDMYYKTNDSVRRTWLLAIIVALMSYAIHGLFNNFLDTDKASVAIWGVVAIIVGLDLCKDEKQSQSTVIS